MQKSLGDKIVLTCAALAVASLPAIGHAEKVRDFEFYTPERSPALSFSKVPDPLSPSDAKVQKLLLDPTKCKDNDCNTNSARALMHEDIYTNRTKGHNGQPPDAWYGWDIYYPKDFRFGWEQAKGGLQFAEFKHTKYCASVNLVHQSGRYEDDLYWRITKYTGASPDKPSEECKLVRQTRVAGLRDLLGHWTRFELHVRWSREDDGEMQLYVDDKKLVDYKGATCYEDCENFNPFYYGIYLSNAPSRDAIKETYVLFKNVHRAGSRDGLNFDK